MKIYLPLLLWMFASAFTTAQTSSPPAQEPKSGFILNINGKEYTISEGDELKLDNPIDHPVISVKLSEFKTFDNGSVVFNYPAYYSFEFDQDFGYKNWTLNGKNYIVMFFELDAQTPLDDLIEGMVKKFGKSNCKVVPVQLKLGEKQLDGKRINISLVGQKLTLDFLEIKLHDFKSRFIAFQDTKNDDGTASEESFKSFHIIDSTIKYSAEH